MHLRLFANLMPKLLTNPVNPLNRPVTLSALQQEELQMNSCYIYALVQKVVNSAPGLQQNCTAAGKVTLEELSTHLLPNPGHTCELLPVPPWAEGSNAQARAEEQQPPRLPAVPRVCHKQTGFCHFFPRLYSHLVGPWTGQEDRSDLHPSMRHKWPTDFLFCLPLFYTLCLKAPRSQALKVAAAGSHLQNGAALPSADLADLTLNFVFFPRSSLHFLQLGLWG